MHRIACRARSGSSCRTPSTAPSTAWQRAGRRGARGRGWSGSARRRAIWWWRAGVPAAPSRDPCSARCAHGCSSPPQPGPSPIPHRSGCRRCGRWLRMTDRSDRSCWPIRRTLAWRWAAHWDGHWREPSSQRWNLRAAAPWRWFRCRLDQAPPAGGAQPAVAHCAGRGGGPALHGRVGARRTGARPPPQGGRPGRPRHGGAAGQPAPSAGGADPPAWAARRAIDSGPRRRRRHDRRHDGRGGPRLACRGRSPGGCGGHRRDRAPNVQHSPGRPHGRCR